MKYKYVEISGRFNEIKISPEVGMVVTVKHGTDSHVYDIIEISKTGFTITLQSRSVELVKKPIVKNGGGSGFVESWETKTNTNGGVEKATYRKKFGRWQLKGFTGVYGLVFLGVNHYYYDYSF